MDPTAVGAVSYEAGHGWWVVIENAELDLEVLGPFPTKADAIAARKEH